MRVARSGREDGKTCWHKGLRLGWLGVGSAVPARPRAHHSTPAMVKVSKSQQRRAELFVLLLRGMSIKEAKKQLRITNTTYVTRLISQLGETASLADPPRSGRPEKYGVDVLCKAQAFLLDLEDAAFCCKDVVDAMIDEDILPKDTSWAVFWPKFVMYLGGQGLSLVWGIQRLTFAMSKVHAKARLQWCKENKLTFTDRTMKHFTFVDEISLEIGGHPKGECK